MSSKSRSIEDIHQEYSKVCSQAGHVQYQIEVLAADLDKLNGQLRELNIEASTQIEAARAAQAQTQGVPQ